MAREHPWTGVGFGNFTAAAWLRPARPFRGVLPVDQPHSGYLLLLAETGLPGVALFLLAFGCALRPAVSRFRRSPLAAGAGLAVGSFLAANLVFTLLLIPGVNHLVFLLLGILAGLHRSGAVGKSPG
jgi:O-antigen ligase